MRTERVRWILAALLGTALLCSCDSSDPVTLKGDQILLFADYITADTTTGQFSAIIKAIVYDPDSGVRRDGVGVFFRFNQLPSGATVDPTEVVTNEDGEAFAFVEANGEVSLTAQSGTVTKDISLSAEGGSTGTDNQPPTADIRATTTSPRINIPVIFDVSASSDPEGKLDSWQVTDWDDGSPASSSIKFSSTKTTTHTFTSASTYTVRVRVLDDQGSTDEATTDVTVQP